MFNLYAPRFKHQCKCVHQYNFIETFIKGSVYLFQNGKYVRNLHTLHVTGCSDMSKMFLDCSRCAVIPAEFLARV